MIVIYSSLYQQGKKYIHTYIYVYVYVYNFFMEERSPWRQKCPGPQQQSWCAPGKGSVGLCEMPYLMPAVPRSRPVCIRSWFICLGNLFGFLSLMNHDGTIWKMCKMRSTDNSCVQCLRADGANEPDVWSGRPWLWTLNVAHLLRREGGGCPSVRVKCLKSELVFPRLIPPLLPLGHIIITGD